MGITDYRTIALIAENHLTLQAKAAVAGLFASQNMADVSEWADEARGKPTTKHTAS